tara:strand:- start:43 stop:1122 length:1080 start_codon:yes stop_codon:yes gene_type:complete
MEEELLQHLKTLISFQTTEGSNAEKGNLLQWVEETFIQDSKHPIIKGEVEGSPYLYLQHSDPHLLWFGHVDVVPGSNDQFSLRNEGEKVYGRGVKDMKGAILSFLLAYRDARKDGLEPNISILLTSDEETAGPTIPTLLQEGKVKAPVAFTPDTGSSPGIVTEHKGVVWAELIAHGSGGHAAMPWKSDNPIWKLSDALQSLKEAFPSGTEDDWQITVTPAMLSGSEARNQIPDTAHCSIDIRYPSDACKDAKEVLQQVTKVLPKDCELREVLSASPLQTDPKHPMVTLIQSIGEEVEGRPIEIIREHGGTDARYFSEVGIPAFLYGPIGGDLHGAQEWVSVPSLLQQYEICRRLLQQLK